MCETIDGDSDYQMNKIAPYLSKTMQKNHVSVQVIHRKYNTVRDKPEVFSIPFVVNVAEWMHWNEVV
jgi:hypothetical protein